MPMQLIGLPQTLVQLAGYMWLKGNGAEPCADNRDVNRFAAEVAGETPGERMILTALAAQDTFSGLAPVSRATGLLRRALADGRFLVEAGEVQFWQAMYLLHAADELDLAERLEQQALEDARNRGSVFGLCIAGNFRAHVHLKRGRVRDAQAEIEHANSLGDHAWPQGLAVKVHVGVETLTEQGSPRRRRPRGRPSRCR